MGATSVTGVSGQGSAAKPGRGNKGSEHLSLAVHRLIGPRVVMAGVIQLTGGAGVVYYPTLPGVVGQYSIQLSTDSTSHVRWASFTTSQFNVAGTGTPNVHWAVIKNGLWGSPTTGLDNS